ncbi:hypothetical protein B4N84_02705 [Flavobacterium sp. IR1]|nr:hypothetical protein B4N84_02705 [Flavobacterium sp. IR1]
MVYVLKTSVTAERQAEKIIQKLSRLTPNSKCNFDLEDCDKILRVEGNDVTAEQIIVFLKSCNFECLELE